MLFELLTGFAEDFNIVFGCDAGNSENPGSANHHRRCFDHTFMQIAFGGEVLLDVANEQNRPIPAKSFHHSNYYQLQTVILYTIGYRKSKLISTLSG